MRRQLIVSLAAGLALAACDRIPGKPEPEHRWEPPSAVMDFHTLYTENCAGCHALDPDGLAAARAMHDPLYLAFIGEENLLKVTSDGVLATTMPGFHDSNGGSLTKEQIQVVVDGILANAKNADVPPDLPPYNAPPGDAVAGETAFGTYCASCHGAEGTGGEKGGSVVDPAFLSLVTDQSLRTTIVAGRPDLGMPDFTGFVEGKRPTHQEIADIVAFLASKRPANAQVNQAAAEASPSPFPNES